VRNRLISLALVGGLVLGPGSVLWAGQAGPETYVYPWLARYDQAQALDLRIPAPEGFERIDLPGGSFGAWLRHLPLKPGAPDVLLYDGRKKANQSAQQAVVDLDVGGLDLQQCADAVIRLRAEYLFSREDLAGIHFKFTSGDEARYLRWREGGRPRVRNNVVIWSNSGAPDRSYQGFRKYLETVFRYAGSSSLSRELVAVDDVKAMRVGDIFIKGGFPGHAVVVVDMARSRTTGRTLFLIAQSYMPAQDIHILKNPTDARLSPWYDLDFGPVLTTPEWVFSKNDLKRFRGE